MVTQLLYTLAGIIAMLIGISCAGTSVFGLLPVVYHELLGKENVKSGLSINFVYQGLANGLSAFSAGKSLAQFFGIYRN